MYKDTYWPQRVFKTNSLLSLITTFRLLLIEAMPDSRIHQFCDRIHVSMESIKEWRTALSVGKCLITESCACVPLRLFNIHPGAIKLGNCCFKLCQESVCLEKYSSTWVTHSYSWLAVIVLMEENVILWKLSFTDWVLLAIFDVLLHYIWKHKNFLFHRQVVIFLFLFF